MKIKGIVFGVDDVLYDYSLHTSNARLNAVKAMIDAGLPVDVETSYRKLEEVIAEVGPDDPRHYDKLLERLGLDWNPSVVAAGVVAYRQTSRGYLRPYPDTVPTLLKLRDMGVKIGCASAGRSVKRWQQLISLGLQHIFHTVVISEDLGIQEFNKAVLEHAVKNLGTTPSETVFVGAHPDTEIKAANELDVISVRIKRGDSKREKTTENQPKYEIDTLSELLKLIERL
jgi:putative hydrolase of the HAD superfamily